MVAYPKSVAFIISNEFCERFCFYGMRGECNAKLANDGGFLNRLTLCGSTNSVHRSHSGALFDSQIGLRRRQCHCHVSRVHQPGVFLPHSRCHHCRQLAGPLPDDLVPVRRLYGGQCHHFDRCHSAAELAGQVGFFGHDASISNMNFGGSRYSTVTLVGLLLIAIGTGGIKPCVSAFGGDQFRIPEQAKQLAVFFSLFYMAINAGSLLSTMITPILREDVPCFGEDTCFSLAFGVPGALMAVSICEIESGMCFGCLGKLVWFLMYSERIYLLNQKWCSSSAGHSTPLRNLPATCW